MDSSVIMSLWRRLQSLLKVFRFVELFTGLILLSWLSSRLPFAVRISGEYCRKTAAFVFCPTSIFLLGNAIVVALLAKSGLFSAAGSSSAVDVAVADLYRKLQSEDGRESGGKEEVIFQDKEIIFCEENKVVSLAGEKNGGVFTATAAVEVEEKKPAANYRRSKSEKVRRSDCDGMRKENEKLRRSETDVCRRYVHGGGDELKAEMTAEEEEGDGGEDFRRTIEAFIAKQVRFHRDESLAVVVHG